MSSVNKVILVGNLGKDPEVRRLNDGNPVVSFSLATTESWRDKATGERKDKTEWHDIVIFNENIAKVAETYLRKGSKVYIEGQLQTREWDDQQTGQKRRRTEVVLQRYRGELTLLDAKRDGDAAPVEPSMSMAVNKRDLDRQRQDYAAAKSAPGPRASLNDDIPFEMEWR